MKYLTTGICSLLLTGCMAVGTQIKDEQLRQVHKGETSGEEVVKMFGPPNSATDDFNGNRHLCYSYIQTSARPEAFIPIVGAFVGGADTHSNTVCFMIDQEGIVRSFQSSSSQTGAGYGFEAGSPAARVSSEPHQAQ